MRGSQLCVQLLGNREAKLRGLIAIATITLVTKTKGTLSILIRISIAYAWLSGHDTFLVM